MGEHDFWRFAPARGVERRAVHRITARRVSAIGPIEGASGRIDVQIDRLWEVLIEEFDVSAVRGGLAFRKLDIRALDTTLAGFIGSLLSPVEFASGGVHRNTDTPFPEVPPQRGSPWLVSTRVSILEPSRLARITRMPSRSHQ